MNLVVTEGTVSWSDTDASGRFHFTAPWRWVEDAEHTLYRDAGLDVGSFPRRAVSATYQAPLVAGDRYQVSLSVDRVGTSSVSYAWTVRGPAGVAVSGSHTAVHVDATGRPAPVPTGLRERLSRAA